MRRMTLLFCLLIALGIAGCSSQSYPTDDEFHLGTDYPHMFAIQGQGLRITPSDTGYYFNQNNLIYYMDKDQSDPVLLDNRPDNKCLTEPDPTNCYALIQKDGSWHKNFLQYYQGKLYILESYWDQESTRSKFDTVWQITRMDKDGKNRKVIKRFEDAPVSVVIHRGAIYYSNLSAGSEESIYIATVMRAKLEGNSDDELLYSEEGESIQISDLVPYGNQLYWFHLEKGGYTTKRLDLRSKEVNIVGKSDDGGMNVLGSISKNRLHFNYFYGDPKDSRTLKIYSANLKGEDVQEVDIEHPSVVSTFRKDDRYSYISATSFYEVDLDEGEPYDLSVYENGEKVFRFNLFSIPRHYYIVTGDDRYLFLLCIDDEEEYYMMLDKEKLGTEEAAFERLIL